MKSTLTLFIASAVILFVGIAASVYVYLSLFHMEEQNVQGYALSLSRLVRADTIAGLSGTADDLQNPDYLKLKKFLIQLHQNNESVRFIYVMGNSAGSIFFYADSEDPSSASYSPPGQPYPEASPEILSVFATGQPSFDTTPDRWGSWISGYAPIKDAAGTTVALLGVDVSSGQYIGSILIYTLLPLIVAVFCVLAWITYYLLFSRKSLGIKTKQKRSTEDELYDELVQKLQQSKTRS